MKKIIYFLILISMILLIGNVIAEANNEDIINKLKQGSSGVTFSNSDFGTTSIKIDSDNNKIAYKDLQGNDHILEGLTKESELTLDSKGNIVKGNFFSNKEMEVVLDGNIKSTIPANSNVKGVDGKNFDVILSKGSKITKEPILVGPDKNSNGGVINYKLGEKNKVDFPEFRLEDGTISHDGKNFVVKKGNSAVLNGVSLSTSVNDKENPIFFNEKKVPTDLKTGYSLVDLNKKSMKVIGTDGKSSTINLLPGNPIVPVNDKNKFGFKANNNAEVKVSLQGAKVISYVRGDFVNQNGQLYLYHRGRGLMAVFNWLFDRYYVVPVDMSLATTDGNVLLRDGEGNPLGLLIGQNVIGQTQISTGPVGNNPVNPSPNPNPNPVMPNWQHNPDNPHVPGPNQNVISNPNPQPNPNPNPNPNPIPQPQPDPSYPTKQEFINDIFGTPSQFPASMLGPNLGRVLQTYDPKLFEKHFGPQSTTSPEQAFADYKVLIEKESAKFGQSPNSVAQMFKDRQPNLYNKYAKYLGFQ